MLVTLRFVLPILYYNAEDNTTPPTPFAVECPVLPILGGRHCSLELQLLQRHQHQYLFAALRHDADSHDDPFVLRVLCATVQ